MFTHDELVGFVRSAADDVFTTMLAVTPEPIEAYTGTAASLSSNGVISLVGLAGSWSGTGTICCSAQCACTLAGQMMMTEYEAVNDEVLDAIAEITNMIIGNIKNKLEERLGPLGLSIPTVVYGRNFSSKTMGKQEWIIVPYMAGEQQIDIQLCIAPTRDAGRPRFSLAEEAVQV
jgi:chemotaxis protein CheX